MNVISLVCSLIIIIGCFLPWLQIGALFSNKGIDNIDGAVILIASIVSGALALNNQTKKHEEYRWVFTVVGVLGLVIAIYDLNEANNRARELAKSMTELSDFFGERKNISSTSFIGAGLYFVITGSVGLILCGVGFFSSKTNSETKNMEHDSPEIVAPKYAKLDVEENEESKEIEKVKTPEEIENEEYRNKLISLRNQLDKQSSKIFGGGINQEIRNLLSDLAPTKREGIYLLKSYNALFKRDLIKDIIKLNSSYAAIRKNVQLFVDLEIVNDTFPYDRK